VHWIIGTAGHIDHGKTSLIKALTGQDTDRLPEEKARGISIDLGFACLNLPDGRRAGVVDVPGHERFIRNMLAGAHGIDLVLFTVAADDGVMPQTREHLDILHLLGVTRAVVVVTKADLASQGRMREVIADIRGVIAHTSLEGAPILPFSFVTGEGLQAVRAHIGAALEDSRRSPREREGEFRLPVDRAFASQGHGLVVTGTATSGEVRPGDLVRRLPGGEVLRVRGVQVHNESVGVAGWGQRIALNLASQARLTIARGDTICHERLTLTCDRFDARIEVRPTAPEGLGDHQRVRVHLGTVERMGKVIPLGSLLEPGATQIAPGETAYCQITLAEPIVAMRGDRFILRDETAQRTIAGGVVMLPAATKHKRSHPLLLRRLETIDRGSDHELLGALVEESGTFAIPLASLAQILNRREEVVRRRFDRLAGVHVFTIDATTHYASEAACRRVKTALQQILSDWHASHPMATGLDLEEARLALDDAVPVRIYRTLVQELSDEQGVVREGNLVRLAAHQIAVPDADRGLVARIATLLGENRMSPPDVPQLTAALGADRRKIAELMRAMEKQRSIVGVAPDLYFLVECIDQVRADLIGELSATGGMTTGQFRDRYKTSRKYAIPLLEFFDRTGITVRIGEVRRLRHPPAGQA
jgi:selenocysteine-specific elongation factor